MFSLSKLIHKVAGGHGVGAAHGSEGGGRYLAREPVTAPHEPPWTAARTDNRSPDGDFVGGAVPSATRLAASRKRRAERRRFRASRYAGQRVSCPASKTAARSVWVTRCRGRRPYRGKYKYNLLRHDSAFPDRRFPALSLIAVHRGEGAGCCSDAPALRAVRLGPTPPYRPLSRIRLLVGLDRPSVVGLTVSSTAYSPTARSGLRKSQCACTLAAVSVAKSRAGGGFRVQLRPE